MITTTLSPLVVSKDAVMPITSGALHDNKIGIMTTFYQYFDIYTAMY